MKASADGRRCILVVDDEPEVRQAVQEFLRENIVGVDVVAAASGADGLKILGQRDVSLIVTDYNMPEMNGAQFVADARRLRPGVRTIVVTAFLNDALGSAADTLAGEMLLQKPFVPDGLLRDVEEALGLAPPARLP